MPVIGLLEGQRLKRRLGAPVITPEAWAQNPGNVHQKDLMTTDWEAEFRANADAARAHYASANMASLDPDWAPTIEDFFRKYQPGVNFSQPAVTAPPSVTNFQPDPATLTPLPAVEAKAIAEAARDSHYLPDQAPEPGGRGPGFQTASNTAVTPSSTDAPKKSAVLPALAALAAYLLVKG